jgi:Bifunctional DNA primase/polymerase, N-terminal
MYNLEEESNKSCGLDLDKHVMPLFQLGFNTIPLRQDSVTPNIPSTNDIYNNPESLTEERLRKNRHSFHNIATIFGKSHSKDKDGKDQFLNCLDIDSDETFARLARISINGKEVNLIDELRKSTYVTKTKKENGYHVYWFSHRQNKPIRTSDCKSGSEFEIKTDNAGHCTLPPSSHRDDPSFYYKSVGQNMIAINNDLYEDLLSHLSDFIKEKPSAHVNRLKPDSTQLQNEISLSDCSRIASAIASAYRNGTRDEIIFVFSGYLWRENVKLETAKAIVTELCKITADEEMANRLEVLRRTYEKADAQELVTGRNKLVEILEQVMGLVAANRIIDEVSDVLNKHKNTVLSELDQNIRNELSGHIFEATCYTPPTFVVAHAVKKQILTFKAVRNKIHSDQKIERLMWGEVIVNAIPVNLVCYENPLDNTTIKYQLEFISPTGESFTTKPKSPVEIASELRMRGLVYKPRHVEEALNAILNGARRNQKMKILRQIDKAGFYYVDGRIVSSDIKHDPEYPSLENLRECAEFLNELISRSKHPEMLVTEIKWGMIAPFSFILKQLSDEGRERWMPWIYLDGYTRTSKTTDSEVVLSIYRRQKDKVGLSSANNIARLGEALSRNTFPKLIDEVKLDPKFQSDLIEAIKHAVQGKIARTKLLVTSEPIDIHAFSPCIFTSNHQLPADPAFRRRFLNFHYPHEDKPAENEIREFESFLKHGWNSLGTLGDFTRGYLLQHQDLIINDKNDWSDIAMIILQEYFKAANLNIPEWIGLYATGNQIEDVEVEEEQIIRSFIAEKINVTFSRNYRSLVSCESQQVDSATNKNKPIMERLIFCLDNQLIPFLHKKVNSGDVYITIDVMNELRDSGISFIQTFADLARMLGTETRPAKMNGKPVRLIIISKSDLVGFIDKDISE